jgi:hypothetical protein
MLPIIIDDFTIEQPVEKSDPTPGPQFSRYREHPGWGDRSRRKIDRSKVKAARKANVKRKGRK